MGISTSFTVMLAPPGVAVHDEVVRCALQVFCGESRCELPDTWRDKAATEVGGCDEALLARLYDASLQTDNEDLWDPGSVFVVNEFLANDCDDVVIEYRAVGLSLFGYGNLFPREPAWYFAEIAALGIPERLLAAGVERSDLFVQRASPHVRVLSGIMCGIHESY